MPRTLLLVHGGETQPTRSTLRQQCQASLQDGVERAAPTVTEALEQTRVDLVYYGDVSNRMRAAGDGLDSAMQTDLANYHDPHSSFASEVRMPLIAPLKAAFDRRDSVLVVAHGLGAVICYDMFWKFSRLEDYWPFFCTQGIDMWITLGSPLADRQVADKLMGAEISGARRYPGNVRRWINVAAEGDRDCAEEATTERFGEMSQLGLVRSLVEKRVQNADVASVDNITSVAPAHSLLGYLAHPTVAALIGEWLTADEILTNK